MPGSVLHIRGAVLEGFLEEVGLQLDGEGWERFGKEGVLGEGVIIWGRRSSHALLQGIFPTQGLNPGFDLPRLLHCRRILYH